MLQKHPRHENPAKHRPPHHQLHVHLFRRTTLPLYRNMCIPNTKTKRRPKTQTHMRRIQEEQYNDPKHELLTNLTDLHIVSSHRQVTFRRLRV